MLNYNILSRISGETKCTVKKTVQMLPVGSLWLLRLRARTRSSAPFCPSSVPHPLSAAAGANTQGRSTPERSTWALTLGLSLVHCLNVTWGHSLHT